MTSYKEFIGGSYESQSPVTDAERTVNWYTENSESQGATSAASLYPVPGFNTFSTVSQVGGRAMFAMGTGSTLISGRCFGIIYDTLKEFNSDGTTLDRGTVAVDANPATISTNGDGGDQLFITSGNNGYCYDLLTNTLTLVLVNAAVQGGFLYGYFVAFDAILNQIRISNLFDGTVWDPTQFLARSIGSDPWTAMLVTPYGQIFLPGSQTGEFLFNAGTFPFPFAPDPSGLIEEGIASTFSVKQAGKSAVWLSTNKNGGYQVMSASGFSPRRISDHGIDDRIANLSRVDNAIGETYEDRGHAFYMLTFPGVTKFVYDFSTGKWHERTSWISATNTTTDCTATFHCFAFNKHLMADRTSNIIYEMSKDFTVDVGGMPMRRVRRAPALCSQHRRIFFTAFEVLLESGEGLPFGQGSNPLVMCRYSNDFASSWGNERTLSAGKIGEYFKRVKFWNLGSGRGRVFEISVTDPIAAWRLTDAFLQLDASSEAA